MLTRGEDKYTSALPRCTCLPTRQHCTEVALGGEQVHLGQVEIEDVLVLLLVQLQLKATNYQLPLKLT